MNRKNKTVATLLVLLMSLLLVNAWAVDPKIVEIDVAPNVLNLKNNGTVVTVHTNLPYTSVTGESVRLNGVEIDWWKSDARGYFVAKFDIAEIKAIAKVSEYNTLSLTGRTIDGRAFAGAQDILVIDKSGRGK